MNDHGKWLIDLESSSVSMTVDGLVPVAEYKRDGHPPEEVAMMEKAKAYGAHSVFFEAGRNGRPPVAQAFIFVSDGPANDTKFAELHKRLWSWGGSATSLPQDAWSRAAFPLRPQAGLCFGKREDRLQANQEDENRRHQS